MEDQLHNPDGTRKTADIRLPCDDKSIDLVLMWSVLTHMFEDDIVHYLKEFKRVLKPDGRVFATVFIYNEEILATARRTNLTPFDLRFEHAYGDGCLVNDPVHPAGAVAFSIPKVVEMVTAAELKLVFAPLLGSWSGLIPGSRFDVGQDALILSV